MSANGEDRADIVILVDEEGNEHDFALVDRFQGEQKEYAVLVPVVICEDEQEGDEVDLEDEAYVFRIDLDDNEEETLVEVDDETEWNQVAAVWEERMETLELEDDDDLF